MKRSMSMVLLLLAIVGLIVSCGGSGGGSVTATHKGVYADHVLVTVSMDQAMAMKDVVEGRSDMFFQAVPPSILRTLSETDKAKLDVYAVPSGSWSLLLNPIPNAAPYVWQKSDGTQEFNPFAIKEIRYALNWLVSRKKLIDEILLGDGDPMFTPMTPGQPGTYRYNLIPAKLGMTPAGNERKAIQDIEAAMNAAAALPENKGKLVKAGKFWQYKGKDIVIKFLIRVDDPSGRLPAGRYIADQIEKAGLKVDRLEWDRSKCSRAVYGGNPADLVWSMYTEGWGAGATRAWWDITISQMYAPYYGYMPGGGDADNWNYTNARIDEIGQKGMNGQFLTEQDYWAANLEGTELGLKDSVRIYLCSQLDKFVANKSRFNKRVAYGLGDGFNDWSIRTADVKPDESGQFKGKKVLRVVMHSAKGSLFMSAMDPVGVDGFSDVWAGALSSVASDMSTIETPNSAVDTAFRSTFDVAGLKTAPKVLADGTVGGDIPVPANAVKYDSATKTWKEVGAGHTAAVAVGGEYLGGKWHHGEEISVADMRYATAFAYEWATKDGEGDKYFEQTYANQYEPGLKVSQGTVFEKGMKAITYTNYFFAPDTIRTASSGAVGVKAGNPGRQTLVPWEIYEALALLVAEGSKSNTVYAFTNAEATTEVDVFTPACVSDIKAKLEDMMAKKHVPVSIKDFIKADDAVKRYKAALDFINKYGHAYISNGPLFISNIDSTTNAVTYDAVSNYLWEADHWAKALNMKITQIDNVKPPAQATKTADAVFEISASSYDYPEIATTPLGKDAKVEIKLQLDNGGEKVFAAKFVKDGQFTAAIPASELANLEKGKVYTVVVMSSLATEAPAVVATSLVLF